MSEIPYREVMEGARFLMKTPIERQLKIIELIMRTVPSNVEDTIKKLSDELGPMDLDNIREVMAFTLAVIKTLATKSPEEIVDDLRKMGFSERNARAIVDKILEELPSAERDADALKELGPEELASLARSWARYFTGDYDSISEWSEETGLGERYLLAASRFLESALKSILSGEMSLRKFHEALISDYGFEPERAEIITKVMEEEIDNLSRVLLFKLLRRLLDAIEK